MRLIDLTGQQFGTLTVVECAGRHGSKVHWRTRCVCGVEREAGGQYLRAGKVNSCSTPCLDVSRVRPWPKHPRYSARDDGVIIGPYGRPLRLFVSHDGYLRITVWGDDAWEGHFAHVVVCEAWHGPRPGGKEVAHLNGNKLDISPGNLAWKTHVENEADKLAHGTLARGERHGCARLAEVDVLAIRASSESSSATGRRYGISAAHVRGIRRRVTWRHI